MEDSEKKMNQTEQDPSADLSNTDEDTALADPEEESVPAMTPEEEKRFNLLQAVWGVISGAAIWITLMLPVFLDTTDTALAYLFLVVFVVVMLVQRRVESKKGIRLRVFVKSWLISLCVGAGISVLAAFLAGKF